MVHALITIAHGHCLSKERLDWTEYSRALSLRTCMESHNYKSASIIFNRV